jgi:hypothetical protein
MEKVFSYLKIAVKYAAIFTIVGEALSFAVEKFEVKFPDLVKPSKPAENE